MEPIKLSALNPHWKRHKRTLCTAGGRDHECCIIHDVPQFHDYLTTVENIDDAHGIWFDCPICSKGGTQPSHGILVWFAERDVPPHLRPEPRWRVQGSSFDDLVLSPSILLIGGCGWHGFIGFNCLPGYVTTC